MTVKRDKHQPDGSFITVERITGNFSIGDREGFKEAIEALIPRNQIDRWRPLAEKFGMGAILDQAEGLLDSTGYSTDHDRFRELMKEAIDGMIKIDEEEVKNLARRGLSFKESKRGKGHQAQAWRDEVRVLAEEIIQEGKKVTLVNVTARINRKINAGDKYFWLNVGVDSDENLCVWFRIDDKGNQDKRSFKTIDNYLATLK